MTDWFDEQFEEERQELAELEYAEVLVTTDPDDIEDEPEEICTCDVDERKCALHNIKDDEEN